MSMMLKTVNPEAAAAIENIRKVGVGNVVVYHARAGYMRDRRSSFPGLVLCQHVDDGSLDLFVIMEREDFAVEERVAFQSHNQPHHCWSAVKDAPTVAHPDGNELSETMAALAAIGPAGFQADFQGMLEPLIARITALENRPKAGRPPKAAQAE